MTFWSLYDILESLQHFRVFTSWKCSNGLGRQPDGVVDVYVLQLPFTSKHRYCDHKVEERERGGTASGTA